MKEAQCGRAEVSLQSLFLSTDKAMGKSHISGSLQYQ